MTPDQTAAAAVPQAVTTPSGLFRSPFAVLDHLDQEAGQAMEQPDDDEATKPRARAAIYVRVSTKEQAMRDGDQDGYSLPTQQEACGRKAASLGADVVQIYLDKDTGTKVDKRPAMQALMARVADERDLDYVIVHKLDRLARNRLDDATLTLTLEMAGATLVSCSEGIDRTPSGRLLHGMLAAVNEYYSGNLSDEIKRKTLAKVKQGGTPTLAPIGYLNVQDRSGGRDNRWVVLDPEREKLIVWAFEAYASGDWPLRVLLDELTDRGLTTRATVKRAAKPLHLSMLHRILTNPYYMGIVSYQGGHYDGNQPALVTPDIFLKVQQVLAAHATSAEKHWKHQHYLKGSIFCDQCAARFCLTHAKGRGGEYIYFFCLGRRRGVTCTQRALQTELVEEWIAAFWVNVRIHQRNLAEIRRVITEDLEIARAETDQLRNQLTARLSRLRGQQRRLLDAYLDGAVPKDVLADKQAGLEKDIIHTEGRLAELVSGCNEAESVILTAAQWASTLGTAYQAADETVRRQFNQAIFKRLFISERGVERVEFTEGFAELLEVCLPATARESVKRSEAREGTKSKSLTTDGEAPEPDAVVLGWNVERLVEVMGLEPTTSTLRT